MKKTEIKKLSEREHILARGQMYIGSLNMVSANDYFFENGKFVYKTLEFVPGLLKIINEIIDNSIDEALRTNFQFSNKIKISFDDKNKRITVEDNGRGIPVKMDSETGELTPVLCWGHARAGANFDDDENRITIGLNGVGSFATNVYSKEFIGETSDGTTRCVVSFKNNAETYDVSKRKNSQQYTTVSFIPDLDRFSLKEEDLFSENSIYKQLIYQRFLNLNICYPKISFYFNNKVVKCDSPKKFLSFFGENFESIVADKFFIGVFPNESEDFKFYSYINGLKLPSGGNHIDYITNEVVSGLREKIGKKYKDIKPGDIKNKLMIVVFMWDFVNAQFDAQTKEKCTNSFKEIKDFLNGSADYEKLVQRLYKNQAIVDPIIETYRIKEEFKKRQEIKSLQGTKKKVSGDKYLSPIGQNKYLFLCEGESAKGGLSGVLGRQDIGYFELRGIPLSTYEEKTLKILQNKEMKALVDLLEIDLTKENHDMSFENVVFGTDSDLDGIHIRGILLGFFMSRAKDLIKQGRIKQLRTPIIVLKKRSGEIAESFLTFNEFSEYQRKHDISKYSVEYKKGLGSWQKEDLESLFTKYGFDYFVDTLEYDETSDKIVDDWLSSETVNSRKEYLLNNEFDIFKV